MAPPDPFDPIATPTGHDMKWQLRHGGLQYCCTAVINLVVIAHMLKSPGTASMQFSSPADGPSWEDRGGGGRGGGGAGSSNDCSDATRITAFLTATTSFRASLSSWLVLGSRYCAMTV